MKLEELKKRYKNKYTFKIIAGVLTIALLGGTVSAYTVWADKQETKSAVISEQMTTKDVEDTDAAEKIALHSFIDTGAVAEQEIDKEESVYLLADATGSVTKTIISEHLYNREHETTLEDVSNLKDIKNVKGKETYSQDGETLTWQAEGADIYYQGTSDEEAPVTEHITYFLDGEEIDAKNLAGKSGKVTIRFDYENRKRVTEEVEGKKYQVYVPFTVVTGMILKDNFTNVKVSNGRVISEGDNRVVIGVAMPGLQESLNVSDEELEESVDIPDYVEVTADVENFQLDMTLTMISSGLVSDMNMDGSINLSDLDEMIEEMSEASARLVDGSEELSEGNSDLKEGVVEYTNGASEIAKHLQELATGTQTLADSVPDLTDGVSQLAQGAGNAYDGIQTLNAGMNQLSNATGQLKSGSATLDTMTAQAAAGAKSLDAGVQKLCGGLKGMLRDVAAQQANANAAAAAIYESDEALAADAATRIGTTVSTDVSLLMTAVATYSSSGQLLYDLNSNLYAQTAGEIPMYMVMDPTSQTPYRFAGNNQEEMQESAVALALVLAENAQTAPYAAYVNTFSEAAGNITTYTEQLNQNVTAAVTDVVTKATGYAGYKGASTALSQISAGVTQSGLTEKSLNELSAGATSLSRGLNGYKNEKGEQVDGLVDGTSSLKSGLNKLDQSVKGYDKKDGTHVTGLVEGTSALQGGIGKLDAGLQLLNQSAVTLSEGVASLNGGAGQLQVGSQKLTGNNAKLLDGVNRLYDGSVDLYTGMKQFDQEAIQKMSQAYTGDIKELVNRMEAVGQAGREYTTFTRISEDKLGTTKFILKTEAIK